MVKRHLNHEVAKLSNLIRDNERILKRKNNNLLELDSDISQLQLQSHLGANLDNMSGQLNSLLSELKGKLKSKQRPLGNTTQKEQYTSPSRSSNNIKSDHDQISGTNEMEQDDEEFEEVDSEPDEEPEALINQLNGYVKSADIPDKEPFNEILQSTQSLVSHLPQNGKGNKQLNEFISSLESCIGAFT